MADTEVMARREIVNEIASWEMFGQQTKPASPQSESEWSERQAVIYHFLEGIASAFGPFDQTTGPEGAHYIRDEQNVFATQGLRCENCAFYVDSSTADQPKWSCAIVDGNIDPGGVCKWWVIPEGLVGEDTPETPQKQAAARKKKPKKSQRMMY